MTQPIGEEFILIRPDARAFRAELQAQIAAALPAVQRQVNATLSGVQRQAATAQRQVAATAAQATAAQRQAVAPAARAASAVVLPPTVRSVRPVIEQTQATEQLAAATEKAAAAQRTLVIPPGVRGATPALIRARTATADLARATAQLAGEQRALIIPASVRSIAPTLDRATAATTRATVATNELAAASTKLAAAQATVAATAARSAGGVILPTERRVRAAPPTVGLGAQAATVAPTIERTSRATEDLATASRKAAASNSAFADSNRKIQQTTDSIHRGVQTAERDVGRYTRGMVAATAASTGFFRAVSFASGAFLLGAAAGATVGAAVNEFRNMTIVAARTAAVLRATGGAANVTAGQVDALAKRTLRLTGVDDELVKQAADVLLTFRAIRNEVGAGNDVFNRATRAVVDISNVFGTDMRSSAIQLGKALQDPVKGVTALRRSGITLTASQRDLIKAMVESGRILSAQKLILSEVERQVGGTSEAIGRTLPGRLRILREEAKNSLGEYVKRINESKAATDLFAQVSQGIAQTFGAIRAAVQAIGPSLISIATGLGRVTQSVGGLGAVIAAIAAYKGLTLAIGVVTATSRVFAAASAGAAQANLAEAIAAEEATVALRTKATAEVAASRSAQGTFSALTGVAAILSAGAFASGNYVIGIAAAGAALAGLVAKAVAARAALIAATGAASAGSVAMSALGGPIGVAALGVGALALGLFELHRATANLPGSLNATKRALDSLNESIARNQNLRGRRVGAQQQVGLTGAEEAAAQRRAAAAEQAAQNTTAARGSLEQIHLDFQLQQAQDELTKATQRHIQAQKDLDAINERLRISTQTLTASIPRQTAALQKQINAFLEGTHVVRAFGIAVGFNPFRRFDTHSADQLIDRFQTLGEQGDKTAAAFAAVATETVALFNRLPTQKEISVIVRLRTQGASTNQILQALGIGTTGGGRGAEQIRLQGLVQPSISATAEEQFRAAEALVKKEQERLKTLRQTLATRREELSTAREQLQAAREAVQAAKDQQRAAVQALADARQAAADARQQLLDTIASAHQAIADAITSAKGNLDQLGQAIADALDKAGTSFTTGGKLGARFRELRDEILRGGGGPETQRAAQKIAFQLEAKGPSPQGFQQQFADLTDAFNRGKITLPQFNRELNALLKNLDIRGFRRQFGTAATNLLLDEITAARRQAALIARGPQRAGGGTQQALISPLQAVAAANRQIADAQRGVASAVLGIKNAQRDVNRANNELVRAEHRLREAEHADSVANTRAIRANTRAAEQLARVRAAQAKIDKPKPKGGAGFEAGSLTNAGATAP